MAERSDGCSRETLLASCTRKKRLQRKMTRDYKCTGVQENIGMFSKLQSYRNSLIQPSLFQRPVRPMFIKLSYSYDDRKLFCELASTCQLAESGFYEERKSAFRLQLHGAIYHPDSFVLMLRHCVNLKAIGYESTSLNRIAADKSHGVIVTLRNVVTSNFVVQLLHLLRAKGLYFFSSSPKSKENTEEFKKYLMNVSNKFSEF